MCEMIYTKDNKKGFTLVELLAVIVILAVIMIIAIPAVLNTMNMSKRRSFETYINRIDSETQKQYTKDSITGNTNQTKIYNIEKDLDLSSTGNFKGFSLVNPVTNIVHITLYNDEYAIIAKATNKIDYNNDIKTRSSINEDFLTADYLCSQVEELTSCVYTSIGEDGNPVDESITPVNHKYDALLTNGNGWRSKITSLVPQEQITEIRYSDNIPEGDSKVLVSAQNSRYPVYVWNEGTVIYYGTEAEKIYLNSNSNSMFYNLASVKHIDLNKFKFDEVTLAGSMFSSCPLLEGTIDLSNSSLKNVENMSYMFNNDNNLEYVIFPNSKFSPTNLTGGFRQCYKLKRINNIDKLDASRLVYLNNTFKLCYELEEVNMTNWNAKVIEKMEYAFQECNKIKVLDFSTFNFSRLNSINGLANKAAGLERVIFVNKNFANLTEFNNAFFQTPIKEIDLSGANFPILESIKGLTTWCNKMKKANFSNINAPNLKDMQQMFWHDEILEEANFTNFVAPNLENIYGLFAYCLKLKYISFAELNNTQLNKMNLAFFMCNTAEVIDLSGFKSKLVGDMTNCFNGCVLLKTIYISREWSNENATGVSTFYQCHNLEGGIHQEAGKTSPAYAKVEGGYFTYK